MNMSNRIFPFEQLSGADLILDASYEGGSQKNAGDDPICRLVGCGNQGGFRYKGSLSDRIQLCVLYSELSDPDWPDTLDLESGIFTYYGDNKNPGNRINDTKKKGNLILERTFNSLHTERRSQIPPFFVFTKGSKGRDVIFRGLAVPGAKNVIQNDDLVAVWKTKNGQRFQNYRASFTILNVECVSRAWIYDLWAGNPLSDNAPIKWRTWVKTGECEPLVAPKGRKYRTKAEQLPMTELEDKILRRVISYFKSHPDREYAFQKCAAELVRLMDSNIIQYDLTRYWRDGGRDAVGKYKIGTENTSITVDFALEAKCRGKDSGSGVKDTTRLISRLLYRQFGLFVTTSYVAEQAYKEIVEDLHPVIIITGRDIANILIRAGYNSEDSVEKWLRINFPSGN
jgi:hypothetical protein